MAKTKSFDVEAYRKRLRLFRELVSGENQADFAKRLGIPFKRWNNYERGYPVPRETAFLILEKFHGMSVEWIWFGYTGNLSKEFYDRIALAEQLDQQAEATRREYARVTKKMEADAEKRRKALQIKTPTQASSSR
jgi:transcriptional regulator with XRE-family HTH domain